MWQDAKSTMLVLASGVNPCFIWDADGIRARSTADSLAQRSLPFVLSHLAHFARQGSPSNRPGLFARPNDGYYSRYPIDTAGATLAGHANLARSPERTSIRLAGFGRTRQ